MALVLADRVQETTTTTGTGTVTLSGAVSGFQSFSAVGNGNTTYYTIADQTGTNWEVGLGTYTASGTTLSRDSVLSSSNSGSLVNFGAGTKNVFVTYPASKAVYNGGALGTPLSGTVTNLTGTASININGTVGATTPNTGAFTTLSATGNVSFDGGTFVFNESGADKDFRIEGDTDANLFFTDASTDRVGIGTSSPGAKLQVNTGAAGTVGEVIQMAASQTADALRVTRSDTNLSLQFTPTGQLSIGDIAASASTVITTGPSTSTNANLKITVNNAGNPNLLLQSMQGGGGGVGGPTSFVYFGDNNRALSYIGGTKTNAFASNASSDLVFGTTSDISAVAVTERARITSAGKVGIGTTSPAAGLDIVSAGQTTAALNTSGNLNLVVSDDGASVGNGGSIVFGYNSGSGKFVAIKGLVASGGGNSIGNLAFSVRNNTGDSTLTEAMRIDYSGYLLVGYTSSNGAYKLQVNSQIFATSATIATSDGRYKENVTPLTGALDIVKALNPVQFTWKQHPVHNFDRSCPTVGFIAQEVQQVLADKPYLNSIIKANECEIEPAQYETVVLEPAVDEVKDDEGNIIVEAKEAVTEQRLLKEAVKEDFYGIAEGNMIAILTKALQESIARIEQLEAKVAALEAQ